MKVPLSWLRDYVGAPDDAAAVGARLGGCGFAVDGIEHGVLDLDVTANRPDCLSIYGIAREVATAFELPLAPIASASADPTPCATTVTVTIEDPALCGRYALAQADVTVGPSPAWLADRLTAAGVRPISNIVDVTNYVMLELGHPMHAFDAPKLDGGEIRTRLARAGEAIVTLDGQRRALDPSMLVIADRSRPVAVAGVMGGAASEVSSGTTRIAIESAWFLPTSVRATSKKLGLKTEASIRFERGADLEAPVRALERALALLVQIGAGKPCGPIVDVFPRLAGAVSAANGPRRRIGLDRSHLARLLGAFVRDEAVTRILTSLGFEVEADPQGWAVTPPSFRVDVTREADLIEEVGRHWGFDRVDPTFPVLRAMPRPAAAPVRRDRQLTRLMGAAGVQEAVTFTFIEQTAAEPFVSAPTEVVTLANPLSEKFAVLRPSLLPGLVDALIYNRRRESDAVRLFEIGSVFAPSGETRHLGWVMTGPRGDHWSAHEDAVDFFDAKGLAEAIVGAWHATLTAVPADDLPGFVRGRAARLMLDARDGSGAPALVGAAGQVRPDILTARGLPQNEVVVGGWMDLAAMDPLLAQPLGRVTALPRHPSIVRDLSIVVDERLPAAEVRGTIHSHAPHTLVSAREFDRYHGPGVPSGKVSLSLRLTFRDAARTLTDGEVQQAVDAIVAALARQHGAVLRG
jgi:phenylalanyl-tRNA synthetase beta chain